MIKVLGLALYGPLAASTRYRLGQYVDGLAGFGIDLQIRHLLGDDYLRRRFAAAPLQLAPMLQAGVARLGDLWQQDYFNVAMLHCELFPLLPGWLECVLLRKPYVYDFDDAFYLRYKTGRMGLARPVLGGKFDTVMEGAAAVTAGNRVLAQYAGQHNASTQYLPTVVDTERYRPEPERRGKDVFTVGWIGSPSTAPYLAEIAAPLSMIAQEGTVRLVVIGGKAPAVPGVEVIEIAWSESAEVDLINSFDVGVMPLPNDEWARGKCAFKLIQYMACAVPVVASPVGANVDLVTGESGFLASTPEEWAEAFRVLRDQPRKRAEMGLAGRERVDQHYSLRVNLPVLAGVLQQAAGAN
ncbi:MAG: glycosyltransferase family 4 protein [Pseudomonas sp.]|nr:glycosyltransferase family 4 protein [Pseudomonas sp.]